MEQVQLNWIANFIWGIADDVLRDLYVRGKYRDVIIPMTVLRRFGAVLDPTKQAVLDMKASLDQAKIVHQDRALREAAGQDFYNTSKFTLHDLKAGLDDYQVYSAAQVHELVTQYLGGADRDRFDPILDACVAVYREQLDEDGQVDFKGKAKAFLRTYGFLSQFLPYTNAEWEKLSIFLNFLVPKLPAPVEEDLSRGILEAIDMDSYRVEKQAAVKVQLPDADAEIEPVPTSGGGHKPEPELDRLSNILKTFNDLFGNIRWTDADRVNKLITEEIPTRVAADTAYQNARKNSDKQNARIEHDKALQRVMTAVLKDDTELFKQFMDNESFRRWLTDTVFGLTYESSAGEGLASRGS